MVGQRILCPLANRFFWHRLGNLQWLSGAQLFATESRLPPCDDRGISARYGTVPLTANKVANDWQTLSLGRRRTHGSARGKVRATTATIKREPGTVRVAGCGRWRSSKDGVRSPPLSWNCSFFCDYVLRTRARITMDAHPRLLTGPAAVNDSSKGHGEGQVTS